jgi:hypothetical protein
VKELNCKSLDDRGDLGRALLLFGEKQIIAKHNGFWVYRFGDIGSIPHVDGNSRPIYGFMKNNELLVSSDLAKLLSSELANKDEP